MRYERLLRALACVAIGTLGGCNRGEPPAAVQSHIAEARQEALDNESRARKEQAKVDASANQSVAAAAHRADTQAAAAAYDVALTRAEGDYRIALAKCEAMAGDAQKACRDQALAELDLAKARAQAARAQGG
jgi:hypothetical protein